jgi:hypothetical protein
VGAFIALSLIVYAADPHAANTGARAVPTLSATATATAASRPAPRASARVPVSPSATPRKPHFPPETLAAFRAFASTGDASEVHQVGAGSEGLPSCPVPNIYVTVNRALTGKTLEADLSAFFVQSGLINTRCQAFLFAYHSQSDYQANRNNGYTAGRVALTDTGSGSQQNLEVDTGAATSTQTQFDFNF